VKGFRRKKSNSCRHYIGRKSKLYSNLVSQLIPILISWIFCQLVQAPLLTCAHVAAVHYRTDRLGAGDEYYRWPYV